MLQKPAGTSAADLEDPFELPPFTTVKLRFSGKGGDMLESLFHMKNKLGLCATITLHPDRRMACTSQI